jgi:hypothetical protein
MSRLPVTTALPRPLWRTDRGAVAVVVAVAMAALLLVGAVVVDIGARARVAPSCADCRGCRGTGRRATVGRRLRTRCEYDSDACAFSRGPHARVEGGGSGGRPESEQSGDADACRAADRILESGVTKSRRYQSRRGCLAGSRLRSDPDVPGRSPGHSAVGHRRVGDCGPNAARRSSSGRVGGTRRNCLRIRRPRPDRRQTRGVVSKPAPLTPVAAGRHSLRGRPPLRVCRRWYPDWRQGAGVARPQRQINRAFNSSAATSPRFFRRSKPYTMLRKIRRPGSGSRSFRSTNVAPVKRRPVPFVSPDFRPPSSR